MRPLLSIKTLFRTWFKTLLTFLLLAAVTFALFSRVAEYTILNREINNAANSYKGIGSAEVAPAKESYPNQPSYIEADPRVVQNYSEEGQNYYLNQFRYQPLTQEQIKTISKLPYIENTSVRYMTAGVSDQFYRLKEGSDWFCYARRFVIEGTISDIKYDLPSTNTNDSIVKNEIILDNYTLLAGDPTYFLKPQIKIDAYSLIIKSDENTSYCSGSKYGYYIYSYSETSQYDTECMKSLKVGDRYIIIGYLSDLPDYTEYYFGDYLKDFSCQIIQHVRGSTEETLASKDCADLREFIDMVNADIHTLDVVYTDDMSTIMRFAKNKMMIESGRELTEEDDKNGSNVCVISKDFAKANKLRVGDKLTLKLGMELFEQYKGLGAVAATLSRYAPAVKTVELEIVGIYMDTDGANGQLGEPHWSYSINTVFVPKSLLPVDESTLTDHVYSPAEVSFTVNAWDMLDFIKTAPAQFEKLGLTMIFYDDGWPDIVDAFNTSKQLSLIAIAGLSAAVVAATGFIVFLFIGRKKKEYAVMRALGTPKKVSARALILPLMVLSIAAVLAGNCGAWIYTVHTAAQNDALSALKNYTIDTSVSPWVIIGCILGELLLVLAFAVFGLRRTASIPPLMLLQDHHANRKKVRKKQKIKYIESENPAINFTGLPVFDDVTMPKKKSFWQVPRYITRHMRRSLGKSLLSLLLPALLIGAFGQFTLSQQAQLDLGKNTVVEAKFVGGLPLSYVQKFRDNGTAKVNYYEYEDTAGFDGSTGKLIVTNNIARYTNEQPEITYTEGYDASCMEKLGEVCIVGSNVLKHYGLRLGDKLHVTAEWTLSNMEFSYIAKYRDEHPKDKITDDEIIQQYQAEIQSEFSAKGQYFTIAGEIKSALKDYDDAVFTPGTSNSWKIYGYEVSLGLLECTLNDPLNVNAFRKNAQGIVQANKAKIDCGNLAFVMDSGKIDNVLNTIDLMEKLYPAVIAAAVLIGSFICGLIVIQTSKEAAILRVLGTTRKKTGAILALEQLFLCILGLLIGIGGLLIYKGTALAEIAGKLGLFASLYFAGCLICTAVCSAIATRHNVLELLQTKE